jgi:hypothetical protein
MADGPNCKFLALEAQVPPAQHLRQLSNHRSNTTMLHLTRSLRTAAAVLSLQTVLLADVQSVTIDWSARTTGQQACVPPAASGVTSVTLAINNANVILYNYTLDQQAYQLPSNDAGNLPAAAPAAGAAVSDLLLVQPDCSTYEGELSSLWGRSALFPQSGVSVPLDQTREALSDNATAINDIISRAQVCGSVIKNRTLLEKVDLIVGYLSFYQAKLKALDADSTASTVKFNYQVDGSHYYTFAVREITRYNGKSTTAKLAWKCGLDDVLTLSVGAMGTSLPYRTYTSQSVPSGSSTQTMLVVDGKSGWMPQGLAMLNYKLWVYDGGPQPGFFFSTGPVFKFGGTPGVSSLGWFTGVSFSLWRRLFITPGLHLGQFADFPAGFTNGSPIPANFGQLNPVTRWSGRFAIGITFQTNSFVKSNASTSTTSSGSGTPPK